MKISVFPHVKKPKQIHEYDVTFEQLHIFISKHREKRNKIDMTAWSPTIFRPLHRLTENATYMFCLVLDIDQKCKELNDPKYIEHAKQVGHIDNTYSIIEAELTRMQIRAIMHTSYSNTAQLNKFRIIFPLEKPIPANDETWKPIYRAAVEWLHSTFGEGLTDKSTCDPARAYYTTPTLEDSRASRIDGKYIDWTAKGDEYKERERIEQEKKRAEVQNRLAIRKSHTDNIDAKRHVTFSDHRRYMYDLLKYDRDARTSLAHKLGAKIVGNRAERWICPACLRNDATYFYIEPNSATSLFCGHVQSCGDKKSPRYFTPGYIAEFYGFL